MKPRIYLIGMPGAGKSTLGRMAADALGAPFFDLDDLVVQQAGKSIRDIFQAEGEAGFRRRELHALQAISPQPRQIVACGGGTVTWPDSARFLQDTGYCIWLRRTIAEIAACMEAGTRPLLDGKGMDGLVALEAARRPLYQAMACHAVDNAGDLTFVSNRLAEAVQLLWQLRTSPLPVES